MKFFKKDAKLNLENLSKHGEFLKSIRSILNDTVFLFNANLYKGGELPKEIKNGKMLLSYPETFVQEYASLYNEDLYKLVDLLRTSPKTHEMANKLEDFIKDVLGERVEIGGPQ